MINAVAIFWGLSTLAGLGVTWLGSKAIWAKDKVLSIIVGIGLFNSTLILLKNFLEAIK